MYTNGRLTIGNPDATEITRHMNETEKEFAAAAKTKEKPVAIQERINEAKSNFESKQHLHENEDAEGLDPAALASRAYNKQS